METLKSRYYVRKPIVILLTFIFSAISLNATKALNDFVPDFAFPQEVRNQSDSVIKTAINEHDDVLALRALMDYAIANNLLLDSDSPESNIYLIDSISEKISNTYRPIALLLEADILNRCYLDEKNIYDSRRLPPDLTLPSDPREWDKDMFSRRILFLVEEATSEINQSGKIPIESIASLLDLEGTLQIPDYTLSDFIILKSADILKTFGNDNEESIIPFFNEGNLSEKSPSSLCKMKAEELLDQMIASKLNEGNSIMSAIALCRKIEWQNEENGLKTLKDSILKFKNLPGEGILLVKWWEKERYKENSSHQSLYDCIIRWLHEYPSGFMADNLEYIVSEISQKRIEIQLPHLVQPQISFKGTAIIQNVENCYILLYRLNNNQADIYDGLILKKFEGLTPIKILELNGESKVPFSCTREFKMDPLPPGLYVAIPSDTKKLPRGWNKANSNSFYSTFRVTDINVISSYDNSEKNSGRLYVVKGANQQPIKGASVKLYEGASKKPKYTLTTEDDGGVSLPNGYFRIIASFGNNIIKTETGYGYYPRDRKPTPHASILTDLSIYRPGDTVKYAVVGWLETDNKKSLIKDSIVNITVRDANFSELLKMNLTLDKEGRASGQFIVPEGRLLGTYRMMAEYPCYEGIGAGAANFEVADYKLPPFLVTLEKLSGASGEVGEELLFRGTAMSFSGMPVSDAQVNITVDLLPYFGIRPNYAPASFSMETNISSDGSFQIALPTSGLKGTRFENGSFSITARVTSLSGDSEESKPLRFFIGNHYRVGPNVPDKIKIESDSIKIYVPAYDIIGVPQKIKVEYKISNLEDSTKIFTGSFISPDMVLSSELIRPGKYRIEFLMPGTDYKETLETVFYSPLETTVPYPTSLWIPEDQYIFDEDQKEVKVSFGSFYLGDYIFCMISDNNGIIERKWIKADSCLNSISVDVSAGKERFVSLQSMKDFETKSGKIRIVSAKSLENMKIETISFRENITAGSKESWKFKFSIEGEKTGIIPAMAVITDKALNSLCDFSWNLNIWSGYPSTSATIRSQYFGPSISYRTLSSTKGKFINYIPVPSWQTYGYPLASSGFRIRRGIMYKMAAMNDSAAEMTVNASMAKSDFVMEVTEEEAQGIESGMTGSLNGSPDEGEITIRPIEMPVAFFNPMLNTDKEGLLSLDFTVPDFNTTWQVQLVGYDEELLNASLKIDAIAAKPVMIKSNLPQYLRTGDKAQISATIYNNSPEVCSIASKIIVTDLLSGHILKEMMFDGKKIPSSGSQVINCDFMVPDTCQLLSVKAYAFTENHSDGEQGFIEIYPSSTPVIESKTFYLSAADESFTFKLPKYKKDASITLKYCDNPIWEVLLSLPTVYDAEGKSSLSLIKSLFALLTGENIVTKNPEISYRLKEILTSEDTLLRSSNLIKDQTLKLVSLQMTPWVNNASSETSRILNISNLLSPDKLESKKELLINNLLNLQNPDGGFSWFEEMKSSPYITSEIIGMAGWLYERNLLPDNILPAIKKAVKYYDQWLITQRHKNIELSESLIISYLYNRQPFNFSLPGEMKEISRETYEKTIKNWRRWELSLKSKAAIVLWHIDNYKSESNTIVSSITEFTSHQHSLYDLSLMLEAFALIDPDGKGLENTRHLLLLKKETENWGSNPYNVAVIHSLISTTPEKTFDRILPSIEVDGQELILSSVQSITGSYTVDLSPEMISGKKMTIKRNSGISAWGGVISQQIKEIKNVKSESIENLSIEKSVYVVGENGKPKNTLVVNKGDKIIVSLAINCGKDMEYVALADERAACMEPTEWLSGFCFIDGLPCYKEVRDDKTSFFIERLQAGKHIISYECIVGRSGEYSLGIASAQCLYSPIQVAHSGGKLLIVSQD